MKLITFVFAAILAFAQAEVDEDGILILTDKNFDLEVSKHDFLLVEFYAEWCGHCKRFAPDYAYVARSLSHLDNPIQVAKLNGPEN